MTIKPQFSAADIVKIVRHPNCSLADAIKAIELYAGVVADARSVEATKELGAALDRVISAGRAAAS